ncbi:MAG: protein kinase [Lentisphaeria bacterium]|nr:protein kinase [Lentisphaeria bacterium]
MALDINTLWSAGKKIHGYTMLEDSHEGSNSIWGKAKSATGQTVFFKKYSSPSSMFDDWYQAYVDYQKEIKKRIDSVSRTDDRGRNIGPTYRFIEFFEELGPEGAPESMKSMDYYQVLEYIDGAKDLEAYLSSAETTWTDRKTFASVFMFAMKTLHGDPVRIIHTDLKPKNLLLIPTRRMDGTPTYQIKIIDLDVAILKDVQAPWHDNGDGYPGSPGYYSPEHLRGQVPTEKSDVFTCGLILYEILAKEGHPYDRQSDLQVYEQYKAPIPHLRGTYGSPEKDAQVAEMLHRMLDPDPARRPTAAEVQQTLKASGPGFRRPVPAPAPGPGPEKGAGIPPVTPVPDRKTVPVPPVTPTPQPPAPSPAPPKPAPAYFKLKNDSHPEGIRVFPDGIVGNRFLESIQPDAKRFYAKAHFQILYHDGKWFIRHCAPADENKTALNKTPVTGEMELHSGDIIEASNADGTKTVMPFTVEIGG